MKHYIEKNYVKSMTSLEQVIASSSFSISSETYSIIQSTESYEDAFAIVKLADNNVTLVVKERDATYHIASKNIVSIDKGWKIVTIDAELPLDLVGFLATISQALADAHISIFAVSSYTTDHILVKEEQIDETISIFQELGFTYN